MHQWQPQNRFFAFFDKLSETLSECDVEEYLFLGGNFKSMISDSDINHTEHGLLIRLVEAHELCDVWQNLNGDTTQSPWLGWTEYTASSTSHVCSKRVR